MEKYGVKTSDEHEKSASVETKCPKCGETLPDNDQVAVPKCGNCGTEPFEAKE
jgi:ribosomal protein L37AE/L43A